jgi:hypothetical protein
VVVRCSLKEAIDDICVLRTTRDTPLTSPLINLYEQQVPPMIQVYPLVLDIDVLRK